MLQPSLLQHTAARPLQQFSSCCNAKPKLLSGFFINRGPHRQVFVCGVEVKATLHGAGNATYKLENCSWAGLPRLQKPIVQRQLRSRHPFRASLRIGSVRTPLNPSLSIHHNRSFTTEKAKS
jgi:hypothetical protein